VGWNCWTIPTPTSSARLSVGSDTGTPSLNSGYSVVGGGPAGQDDYYWVCAVCYEMWRDHFCWTVLDTRDEAIEPPDLLEVAFEWLDSPAGV
jgi:hypothetical protein